MFHYLPKLWLFLVSLLIVMLIMLIPRTHINSNLFDLLPSHQTSEYSEEFIDQFTQTVDQQLIWLISSNNSEESAEKWIEILEKTEGIKEVVGKKTPEKLESWAKYTQKYATLLSEDVQNRMKKGDYPTWVLSQIYSPFSGISIAEIQHDPMLLMRSIILEQLSKNSQFSIQNGWLTVMAEEGMEWIMIRATVDAAYESMMDKKLLVKKLNDHAQSLEIVDPNLKILKKGSVYYTDFAIKTAEKDIATIGTISTIGIIIIFFWIFRSLKSIVVTLLALSIGLLTGTVTVLLIYGEIHIITIVMSTSIIGVAIDYTLLFLTSRMLNDNKYTPTETLKQITKPLLGALVSTLLAYCVLLFAPFAGLEQLAIFTMSGLIAVFLTVVCWFPKIANIKERKQEKLCHIADHYLKITERSFCYRKIFPIVIMLVSIIGMTQLTHNDDVGALQVLPPELLLEDKKIGELLGQSINTEVVMVTGENENEVLKNLESLYPLLDSWVEKNIIESYQQYPFQSIERQQDNHNLLNKTSMDLQKIYDDQGIDIKLSVDDIQIIQPSEWINSPLSEGWELLWKTLPNGESAIILSLGNIKDIPKLISAIDQQDNIFWIDRKGEISELFSIYRNTMEYLLVIAVSGISVLFMAFKGIRQGFNMAVPIVLAVIFPLGIMGLIGIELNLFNILALILVVGMSIDYVLFFSSSLEESKHVALITIILAAIISELTFGLLALSGTNAIAGFGLMLLLGILTALFFSPLAMSKQKL